VAYELVNALCTAVCSHRSTTMFFGVVSGGLVAHGLIATATRVGTAFYAFGLALLPTLTFVGLVTLERALQYRFCHAFGDGNCPPLGGRGTEL
jgi:hypothetical protein